MTASPRSRTWTGLRKGFRWLRILTLLLILACVTLLVYVNQIGLPDVLKNALLTELRSHGMNLQFDRMRLHWFRGIVMEQVSLGRTQDPGGPQLTIGSVELSFNRAALRDFRLEVSSLRFHQARFIWPLSEGQPPEETLDVEDIQTDLRFLPNDQWQLDRFQGRCLGADFRLMGSLTNASGLRRWNTSRPTAVTTPNRVQEAAWRNLTRQIVTRLKQLQFQTPPRLTLSLQGDALEVSRFNARLGLEINQAQSPWGQLLGFHLNSLFAQPPGTNAVVEGRLEIDIDRIISPEIQARQVQLTSRLYQHFTNALPLYAEGKVAVQSVTTPWGLAKNLTVDGDATPLADNPSAMLQRLQGQAVSLASPQAAAEAMSFNLTVTNQAATGWIPKAAHLQLELQSLSNHWGRARQVQLALATQSTNTPDHPKLAIAGSPWAQLAPYVLDWQLDVQGLQATNLVIDDVHTAGHWQAPHLELRRLQASLFGGQVSGSANLEATSRQVRAQAQSDFDLQQIRPLLRPNSQRWLQQFQWRQTPHLTASATATLPPWTNRPVRWQTEVLPTLDLQGKVQIEQGAYRTVPASTAETHFHFSNLVWNLPDLHITRPEGTLDLVYWNDTRTQDYRFDIRSHMDPPAALPLLEEPEQKVLKQFEFGPPPVLTGTVWGRWRHPDRTTFQCGLWATNLAFRGQTTSVVQARLSLTNRVLRARDVVIHRGEESILCPLVTYDVDLRQVILSNAVCDIDPLVVTEAIGPKTTAAIQPYRFGRTPHIQVNGTIPIQDADHPNLWFEVKGGPFSFSRFNLDEIQTQIHWQDDQLILTNVQAAFYQGRLAGDAAFDFAAAQGADFHFLAHVSEASLHPLMMDLRSKTNRMGGSFGGVLQVNRANTRDWQSWNGLGHVQLKNGLIWEIPLFGLFTPMLNTIYPGLGNNKASDGSATFTLTNSLIYSRDLEIRAAPVRLHYDGTIDFDGNVNARVEAILLRDTWLVGRLFSLALYPITKVFEYRVTGTLSQPKSEPLYLLPRILLMPLHPFRTLKDLFTNDSPKPK